MFFLFSLTITLFLFYFIGNPTAHLWAPYGSLGVVLFGSWALIYERRFMRALPLLGTTAALFFTLLLLESAILQRLVILGIGGIAWVWWRTVGVRSIDRTTERALLTMLSILFFFSSTSAAFAFAIYLATPVWQLSLLLFFGVLLFCAASFSLRGTPSWFLAACAIALLAAELFLVVHVLPVAFAVKSLTLSIVILTIMHLYERPKGAPMTPRYTRMLVGTILVCVAALLGTAAWV